MIGNQLFEIIHEMHCCKYCLYRIIQPKEDFGNFDFNEIQSKLAYSLDNPLDCNVCKGNSDKCISVYSRLEKRLMRIEFESFLIGVRLHKRMEFLNQKFINAKLSFIPIKQFITRIFTQKILTNLHKTYQAENPDLTVIIDIKSKPRFNIDIRSIYLLGKYQKLERGIPQTKWPCSKCKGEKCESCNFTGQQYPFSVESIIAEPFIVASKSLNSSFHGAGREDIDALMLGSGRPFVLELKQPLIRNFDIDDLAIKVNKSKRVQISNMRLTKKSIVAMIKNSSPHTTKEYRAKIKLSRTIDSKEMQKLTDMGKSQIRLKQQTPERVSHRRADKIREKIIYSYKLLNYDPALLSVVLQIEAQGGTYIKEFISGDNTRTEPNLSQILNQPLACDELDVLKVDDKGLFTLGYP